MEGQEESLKLFKFSIDNAPDAVFWHNKDGGFVYVNDRACKSLGYTREEFAGLSVFDIDPKATKKNWEIMWKDLQSQKSKGSANFRLTATQKRKDGSVFPVEVSISHFWVNNKEYNLAYVQDITKRKQSEQALVDSEDRFKALHNATFGGIAIHDKGVILDCNKGLSEITGYSFNELIGMDGLLLIAENWRKTVMDNILSGYEKPYEAIGVRKNGEEYHIRLDARNIPYKGKYVRSVEFRDITEQKIVELEIVKAKEKAEESEQKLQRIIEFAPISIGLLNEEEIVDVNSKACDLTGYSKEELIGEKTRVVFLSELEYERISKELYQQIEEQGFGENEATWKRKDGRQIYVYFALTYLNPQDPSKGVLFTALDITQRKQYEKALEKRVLALTRPLDDIGSIEFADMFNVEELQKLQDSFAKATGVASLITYPDGTPITQPSNFCKLCTLVRSTEKGLRNCMMSDSKIGKINRKGPTIEPCLSAGLWDAGASITVGGVHVANWLIGQVRNKDIKEEDIIPYSDEVDINREEFRAALNEVNIMSQEQFQAISDALYLLANELSLKSYQNFQQARFIAEQEEAEKEIRAYNEELQVTTEALRETNLELEQALIEARKSKALEEANNELKLKENLLKEQQYELEAANEELKATNDELYCKSHIINTQNDELKEALENLKNTQAKLLHADKMASLGILTAGVAHEINNPMNYIVGAYEGIKKLLKDADYDSRIDFLLDAMKTGVDRTVGIVRSLNQFSRETQNLNEECDIHEIIDNCLIMLQSKLKNRIEVNKHYSNVKFTVIGNVGNLHQVFTNILSNAEQAIENKGEINIHTSLRDSKILIEITDTGIGIEKENLKQVADPFYTTKPPGKGTGLGLSISYNIIKEHNGTIEFDSDLGKGTTVRIVLPVVMF